MYEQIVLAVAAERGVEPTDLDPLYATIDPEALDTLFKRGVEGAVEFSYEGFEVTVHSDGSVRLDGAAVDVGHRYEAVDASEDASEIGASK